MQQCIIMTLYFQGIIMKAHNLNPLWIIGSSANFLALLMPCILLAKPLVDTSTNLIVGVFFPITFFWDLSLSNIILDFHSDNHMHGCID